MYIGSLPFPLLGLIHIHLLPSLIPILGSLRICVQRVFQALSSLPDESLFKALSNFCFILQTDKEALTRFISSHHIRPYQKQNNSL